MATIAVAVLACLLFGHVMFGANGMIVYKQKRAEYESLRNKVMDVQRENDRYAQQVQALKSDKQAIEKEAREQLGYAKRGEYVYVPPVSAKPGQPTNHSAKR
jgi:cell division protein FtsB